VCVTWVVAAGDDSIRPCEGLLTLNGLANRRLQPLGHISVPESAKTNSSRETRIVKVLESRRAYAPTVSTRFDYDPARWSFCGCGLVASHRTIQLLDLPKRHLHPRLAGLIRRLSHHATHGHSSQSHPRHQR